MTRRMLALSLMAVLVCCGQDVHRIDLILGGVEGQAQGFLCVQDDDPDKLLIERVSDYGAASMVVDFLRLDGIPGSRVSELLAWCETRDCTPIADTRVCIDLDLEGLSGDVEAALAEIERQLRGRTITEDAPAEPVLIRVVAVAQPCSGASAVPGPGASDLDVDCDRLLGCVYSGPITLGEVDGDVVLDLDFIGDRCQQAVEICASSQGLRVENVCPW